MHWYVFGLVLAVLGALSVISAFLKNGTMAVVFVLATIICIAVAGIVEALRK